MDTELTVTIRNAPIFYLDHWLHDTNRPTPRSQSTARWPTPSQLGLQFASWPALPCIILGQENTQGLNWAWQLTTHIHSSTSGKGSGVIGLRAVDPELMTSHGIFQPPSQTSCQTRCHSKKQDFPRKRAGITAKLTQLEPARESQRENTLFILFMHRQNFDSNNINEQANICLPAAAKRSCMIWHQPTSNLQARDQDQAGQYQEPELQIQDDLLLM